MSQRFIQHVQHILHICIDNSCMQKYHISCCKKYILSQNKYAILCEYWNYLAEYNKSPFNNQLVSGKSAINQNCNGQKTSINYCQSNIHSYEPESIRYEYHIPVCVSKFSNVSLSLNKNIPY